MPRSIFLPALVSVLILVTCGSAKECKTCCPYCCRCLDSLRQSSPEPGLQPLEVPTQPTSPPPTQSPTPRLRLHPPSTPPTPQRTGLLQPPISLASHRLSLHQPPPPPVSQRLNLHPPPSPPASQLLRLHQPPAPPVPKHLSLHQPPPLPVLHHLHPPLPVHPLPLHLHDSFICFPLPNGISTYDQCKVNCKFDPTCRKCCDIIFRI